MARPVTTLVIFFLCFNLFAGMVTSTGVADTIGIDAQVGEDQAFEDSTGKDQIDTGAPTGSTLFGMYNVLTNQIKNIFFLIFPGLRMLTRAGVPSYITAGFLSPLFSVMIIIGLVSFLRGWDL